jgi:hypothetical protein
VSSWKEALVIRLLLMLCTLVFGLSQLAAAEQFVLNGDERLNTFGSGLPGTDYQTAVDGADYDQIGGSGAHPGQLVVTGSVQSLNYHLDGAPGFNINQPFGPDLQFTLTAELLNSVVNDLGGGFYELVLEYGGVAGVDLTLTDPFDSSLLLQAELAAGTLNGQPVAPVTASAVVNTNLAIPQNVQFSTFALFQVTGGPYASLFGPGGLGGLDTPLSTGSSTSLEIGDLDGNFDFDDLYAALLAPPNPGDISQVLSHTAHAAGQVFGLTSSQFQTPEPTALSLLALGLAALAGARRSRRA